VGKKEKFSWAGHLALMGKEWQLQKFGGKTEKLSILGRQEWIGG